MNPKTYDLSTPDNRWGAQEVVGEFAYRENLKALVHELQIPANEEAFFTAELVPEPDNPHSPSRIAISVRRNDKVIGYIPEGDAESYQQIRRVVASDLTPVCKTRIWYYEDYDGDNRYYLRLCLRSPESLLPLNDPPYEEWALLPYGNVSQVTKESDHLDVLLDYVPPTGVGQLLVTLHLVTAGVRTKHEAIEVRIDGERIGELTKQTSAKFASAVRYFDEQGVTTVALATIKGSSLSAEVTLHAAKSHELSEEDLEQEFSPLPRLVPYCDNAGEYEVPDAYKKTGRKLSKRVSPPVLDEQPAQVDPPQSTARTHAVESKPEAPKDIKEAFTPTDLWQSEPPKISTLQEKPTEPEMASTREKKHPKSQIALWAGVIFSGMCLITAFGAFAESLLAGFGFVLVGLGVGLACGWELFCRNEDKKAHQQWRKQLSEHENWSQYLTDEEKRQFSGAVSPVPPEKKPRQWLKVGVLSAVLIVVGFALSSAGMPQTPAPTTGSQITP